jgi:hypothetical protein
VSSVQRFGAAHQAFLVTPLSGPLARRPLWGGRPAAEVWHRVIRAARHR